MHRRRPAEPNNGSSSSPLSSSPRESSSSSSPAPVSQASPYAKSFVGKRKRMKQPILLSWNQIKMTLLSFLRSPPPNKNHPKKNHYATRHDRMVCLKRNLTRFLGLFVLLGVTPNPLSYLLFGLNPIHGGLLGKYTDHERKLNTWQETLSHVNDQLQTYDVALPNAAQLIRDATNNGKNLNVPQAVMREMLLRAFRRKDYKRKWYHTSQMYWKSCHTKIKYSTLWVTEPAFQDEDEDEEENEAVLEVDVAPLPFTGEIMMGQKRIPPLVVRPNHPTYYGPLYNMEGYSLVVYEDWEQEAFLKTLVELMSSKWSARNSDGEVHTILDFMKSKRQRMEFWIIAFLFQRGGIYLGQGVHQMESSVFAKVNSTERGDLCGEPVGVISVKGAGRGFDTLAISPGHDFLKCLLDKFVTAVLNEEGQNVSIFTGLERVLQTQDIELSELLELPQTCPNDFSLEVFQDDTIVEDQGRFGKAVPDKDISVNITFDTQTENMDPLKKKKSLMNDLSKPWFCGRMSTWNCHRCLKDANFGTYNKCKTSCGRCLDPLFNKADTTKKRQIDVKVEVNGFKIDKEKGAERMIPRIIHQTWSEEINPMKYPQLFRLQNSWKASGWSYRFYSDDDARSYIMDNFPPQFLEAYDSIIPGAYKADLFRYLVLMKDGGVYADVDVLLDGSLDSFITPTMSFFVPRDAVGEYAQGSYCLWNGLLGAAPGHPFIVRAVERLVNLILDRSDLLDFEKEIALKSGRDTEFWKVRALPELMLSGPCALGVSVNEALANSPVTSVDVGWMKNTSKVYDPSELGDVLILMQDKNDMGAMRFTDVERNVLVASTDMPGLSKKPLSPKGFFRKSETTPHYSKAASGWKGFHIWGRNDIYIDSLMSNELVKLDLRII